MDVGFGTSWPANQYDGHPAWWWTGLSGEVIGIKAKASLSPLKSPGNIVTVDGNARDAVGQIQEEFSTARLPQHGPKEDEQEYIGC